MKMQTERTVPLVCAKIFVLFVKFVVLKPATNFHELFVG